MKINNLKIMLVSSLIISISMIFSILVNPISNMLFGVMGVDSFIILTYSAILYSREFTSLKTIVAINVVHVLLIFMLRPNIIGGLCIGLAQLLTMFVLIIYSKYDNLEYTYTKFRNVTYLLFITCDTLAIAIFSIVSYKFFGLLYWVFISSVIVAPFTAVITAVVFYRLFLAFIMLYPNHFKKFIVNLSKI